MCQNDRNIKRKYLVLAMPFYFPPNPSHQKALSKFNDECDDTIDSGYVPIGGHQITVSHDINVTATISQAFTLKPVR